MPVRFKQFSLVSLFLGSLLLLAGADVSASGEPRKVKRTAKKTQDRSIIANKSVKLRQIGIETDSVEESKVTIERNTPPIGSEGQQKNDWFYKKRAWPDEHIDPSAFKIAAQQAKQMPALSSGGKHRSLATERWKQLGPTNIGGRVTSIATHPSDANTYYVGAAAGGVWKTTNKGESFTALTDTFASLPVGALRIDPRSPETIYLGQGECNFSADSWPGNGLWRSDNGGSAWAYLGLAKTQFIAKILIDPRSSDVIYVAAPGPLSLSDTNRGVYKSTDRGASWVNVLRPRVGNTQLRVPIIDLAMNPTNPDELVAAAWDRTGNEGIAGPNTGLWHTTNAGSTWSRIDTMKLGYPDGRQYNFNRTAIHWANTSEGPVLYSAISRNDTNELTKRNSNANFHGLYASKSPATNWLKLQDSTLRIHYGGLNYDSVDILHRQGYYNFYLEGNPHNGDELYIGGIDVIRSTDAGKSFSNITSSYTKYFRNDHGQHPDQHHLAFTSDPKGKDLLVASDGGVYRTSDFGSSWSHDKGLPITMFYSLTPWYGGMKHLGVSIVPDSLRIFGGTQDNGTVAKGFTESGEYAMINNADGGVAIAHPTDPEKIFVSKQQGRIFLRVGLDSLVPSIGYDGPATDPEVYKKQWHNITRNLITGADRLTDTSEPVGFIAPYAIDPNDATELYTGRMRLYKAKINYERPELSKWSVWSPYLTGDTSDTKRWTGLTVEAIAVGPRDAAGRPMLWMGGGMLTKTGALSRSVYRTAVDPTLEQDAAPRWVDVKNGLPTALPSMIVADPTDSMTAFIAYARYATTRTIYKTTNGGTTWVNITGNLPQAPVNAIVIDTAAEGSDITKKNQFIFAATDVGVFMTTNGGVSWSTPAEGLPVVVVNDIKIYKNLLIAGTHGRSAWTLDLDRIRGASSVNSTVSTRELVTYPNPVTMGGTITFDLAEALDYVRLINVATGADASFNAESGISTTGDRYELSLPDNALAGGYILQVLTKSGEIYHSKVVIR